MQSLFADNKRYKVKHLNLGQIRILVGTPINLHHDNKQIIMDFGKKIKIHASRLVASALSPNDKYFSCL